ncbi:glyoxylase-like metal-dependent hydrolase (beta-lactamase superfamily II) [Sphingomonas jejuensis]|uniref:Glyoxylase-like metal-dependent hydrolase (Beta-lactamase superfamily II) n=1 Tax=Sphingomonas jejuensis TaxID=904715 RepID=A0ABX0XQC7_9SPHN|nr:MBL fold metallo-hydrolase [Sphingomonas jejuensis]NJC34880.1 glyoxylase-like metal-dependent hydrolase (beta-lactamase superfamily II) [Sphingomonas jejuensis]
MTTQPPLRAAIIPVTPLQQNCSLIWCTATMRAALVDPGGDRPRIREAVTQAGVSVEKILLTHGHIDHCGEAGLLAAELGVPIEGPHEADRFWIARLGEDGRAYGMPDAAPFEPNRWLKGGDSVTVGDLTLDVYFTPGHTPGHVTFHHPASALALVGDVLFAGSVGRTDFPLSDHQALIRSVTEVLWPLGDDTVFIPGHGPTSTFGHERRTNGFVADHVLAG